MNAKEDKKENDKKRTRALVKPPVADHHVRERANR